MSNLPQNFIDGVWREDAGQNSNINLPNTSDLIGKYAMANAAASRAFQSCA